MRAAVPMGLSSPLPREGPTSSIKPLKPAASPIIINFVIRFLNINNASIVTQRGMVEFSNPLIPDARY
jgi:hypothetical protein